MMDPLPAIQLLESTHHFPGPYMFKVIGSVEGGFVARVLAAVREEMGSETDPPHRTQQTASGRHVSVTLEPRMQNAEQVLAVYRRIRAMTGLVMVW